MYVFTKVPLCLERLDRLHFPGSNLGNNVGPVAVPKWESLWMLNNKVKNAMLDVRGKVLAGGADPVQKYSKPEFGESGDMEPVAWHAAGKELVEEVLHSFKFDKAVFLTCLDDTLPWAALNRKLPCVVLVFSLRHKQQLRTRLVRLLWDAFRTPGSLWFQPALVDLAGAAGSESSTARQKKAGGKRKKGSRGRAKGGLICGI
jgi:hypothetical protein